MGTSRRSARRQHHFVSAWLLRRFTGADGHLRWWSRDLASCTVRKGSPETVFRQRDLNTLVSDDGTRDQSVEDRLADEFDDEMNQIAGRLVEQGRSGKRPEVTDPEKAKLDEFLFVQSKRSPEWRTETLERDVYRDLTGCDLPPGVPPRFGSGAPTSEAQRARAILQNDFADSLLRGDPKVAAVLRAKGLLLCLAHPEQAFIVGTTAVVSAGSGEGSLHKSHMGARLAARERCPLVCRRRERSSRALQSHR